MPQMGYDTKTDRLTDCQSQCDFDMELGVKVVCSTEGVRIVCWAVGCSHVDRRSKDCAFGLWDVPTHTVFRITTLYITTELSHVELQIYRFPSNEFIGALTGNLRIWFVLKRKCLDSSA
jgi:hypothetical protein